MKQLLHIKNFLNLLIVILSLTIILHSGETVKVMPLGDSITYGNDYYNVPDPAVHVSYRRSLSEGLSGAGYTVDFIGSIQSGTVFNPPFDPDHQGYPGFTAAEIAAVVYNDLSTNEPEVVLLHIGTNELRTDTADVELALNEIDRYENDNNVQIQVILARIINRWAGWDDPDNTNRTTAQQVADTTTFNNNLQTMADTRIAAGDDIIVVDMETDSGIIYDSTDMVDDLHANESGYAKMANIWFGALQTTLPTHLWKFDEPVGATTFIDTYRDNDGTCMGAACPQSTPGILGSNARLFDGNDEVTVSDDDTFDWSGNDSFTIKFWVKPTRTDGANQVIVGRENQAGDNHYWWAGILGSNGSITFRLRDSAGTQVILDGPVLNTGEWYHVVCVRDGANDQNIMYVNGESVSASATYAGNFSGNTPVNVGYYHTNNFHLDSAVDELTVYNGAMNVAQANLHYERGIAASLLSITSTPVTLANVGSSYLYDVESTMDPSTAFTYSAVPDLSWMNIDTDTGVISGTVTDEFIGNVDMSVEATNTPQTDTQDYVLQIRDPDSLPASMSHYWKFDETETTETRTYIDSYAGADGTCTGGDAGCPTPRPGRIGGAQSFDGSDMVDVINTTGFDWAANASFTIVYWIRIDDGTDLTNNMVVIGRDGDSYSWWAGIQANTGNAIFSLRSNDVSSVVSTSTIVGDTGIHAGGHHVAIVRDGAARETRLYIDGNLTNTTTHTYNGDFMDSSASAVNIGYLNFNGTPGFFLNNGTSGVDDMAVFNRAMSTAEIQEHYDNSFAGNSFEAWVETATPVVILPSKYSRSNNIVTDHDTGLQWQDTPYTAAEKAVYDSRTQEHGRTLKWINAEAYCSNLGNGWRLPSIDELLTIVDKSYSNPAMDPIFQSALPLGFWSSTLSTTVNGSAQGIGFAGGNVHNCGINGPTRFIRCARTGTATPPPADNGNTPPTADAGPDKTVQVNHPITISGSGNDSDGVIVSYLWTKKSNGQVLANTESFDFTPTGTRSKTLVLTVTDDDGATASDEMILTVTDGPVGNTPPTADAGVNQNVQTGILVTLDGSGSSDANSDALTYSWSFTSRPVGSTVMLTNPTSINPTFTPDVDGNYVVELIVNDGTVDSSPDSMTVTASATTPPTNTPPTADAGPDKTVQVNNTVTISGISSDSDGSIVKYEWKKQSNGQILATTESFDFTPTGTRTKTLVFTVTDDDGATASDEMILTVTGN